MYKKLIEDLRRHGLTNGSSLGHHTGLMDEAADAIMSLQALAAEQMRDSETLKRLLDGEWVETEAVEKALGISFVDGLRRFDFSRTAEWWSIAGKTDEERARNGQKITTCFRLKTCIDIEQSDYIPASKSKGGGAR